MKRAAPVTQKRAKELRLAPTRSERRLWNWPRNRTFDGYKFRRQAGIGPFIADFYCAALKLVLEVDGKQHEDPLHMQYDDARTLFLNRRGIDVVRIPNALLARQAGTVEQVIQAAIDERRKSVRCG